MVKNRPGNPPGNIAYHFNLSSNQRRGISQSYAGGGLMINDILDAIGLVVILAFFYMLLHAEPALTAMIIEMKGN